MDRTSKDYGTVTSSTRVSGFIRAALEAKTPEELASFARCYPATLIGVGMDPTPYLEGTDIDMGEVMEFVKAELAREEAEG